MLSADILRDYLRAGFTVPFRVLEPVVAQRLAEGLLQAIGPDAAMIGTDVQCRHLDLPVVFDLCAQPSVLDRVEKVLGPDIVLWRSNIWCKQGGSPGVPWHQDDTYWPISPKVGVTAWLALTDATEENGCLEFVPDGSGQSYPLTRAIGHPLVDSIELPDAPPDVTTMPLQAGECVLFSPTVPHRSGPNITDLRRIGVAIRYTVPTVTVDHDRLLAGHQNIVVRGTDGVGLNRIQEGPRRAS